MSRFISALRRHGRFPGDAQSNLEAVLREIAPEQPPHGPVHSAADGGGQHLQATHDMPDRYLRHGLALCQGKLYEPAEEWWKPGTGVPDGSFAIVRDDSDVFEAVSDPAGSRMLWFYFDDGLFVVSNSERAITMFVGRFDFDPEVVPWVVSTGTRGPGRSYNRHLHLVPPSGVARLDKTSWTLDVGAPEIRFEEARRSREEHLDALEAALRATFASFGAEDAQHTLISLSGGCDSRALAILLSGDPEIRWRSFTSGSARAAAMPSSDVTVAARVARALGLDHRHIVATPTKGKLEARIKRFVLLGEGRHDHVNSLQNSGTNEAIRNIPADSILRGDKCFGSKGSVATPFQVRKAVELLLCSDIANFRGRLARFGLDGHRLPSELQQRPDETLTTWRDRLYGAFRVPNVLAALTESKAAHYDAVNPLLSRRALDVARSLPDSLRSDKALLRELVVRLGPDIPFATLEGAPRRTDALRGGDDVVSLLRAALASATARQCFGAPLVAWLRAEIHPLRGLAERVLRAVVRRLGEGGGTARTGHHVPPLRLAFRVYVATTMIDQLAADATRLTKNAPVDVRPTKPRPRAA